MLNYQRVSKLGLSPTEMSRILDIYFTLPWKKSQETRPEVGPLTFCQRVNYFFLSKLWRPQCNLTREWSMIAIVGEYLARVSSSITIDRHIIPTIAWEFFNSRFFFFAVMFDFPNEKHSIWGTHRVCISFAWCPPGQISEFTIWLWLTVCHGKSPCLIAKPSISMGHLYHGYVK